MLVNNIDKAYQDLLGRILEEGKLRGDRTGTGTVSIFSHTLEMDMSEGFPLLTTKKMFTKGIIHELLWFLNGDTNIQYLVKNGVNIWTPDAYREYNNKSGEILGRNKWTFSMEEFKEKIVSDDDFAKEHGELGPIYGKQWVDWTAMDTSEMKIHTHGINQIQQVMDKLINKPEDRRIIVSAWNVAEIDKMALPPCHYLFELYTEELTFSERRDLAQKYAKENNELPLMIDAHGRTGTPEYMETIDNTGWNIPKRKLSLKWHQRSVDTFLGLPFNIASYGFLLHMFAQQANMVPSKLVGDLTNVHIYKNHREQCEEQLSRESMELPKLDLNKAKDIFSYTYEDFKIENYESHPPIKGEISV